jgi:hypothetical protein
MLISVYLLNVIYRRALKYGSLFAAFAGVFSRIWWKVFAVYCILVLVFWGSISLIGLVLSFNGFLFVCGVLIFPVLFWPFGRIVVFNAEEVADDDG